MPYFSARLASRLLNFRMHVVKTISDKLTGTIDALEPMLMKKLLSAVAMIGLALILAGCPGGADGPSGASVTANPEIGTQNDEWFNGQLAKFDVVFSSSFNGPVPGTPLLTYSFELKSKSAMKKGTFMIYDCHDSACAVKYLLYQAECNFDLATCKLTDGSSRPVANAGDFAQIESLDHCDRIEGGEFGECTYLSIVDPRIKRVGFYDQYFAVEFIPHHGNKTDLSIFHLHTGN
jgi:hypothetical protein